MVELMQTSVLESATPSLLSASAPPILIATDGTAQSDPAIELTKAFVTAHPSPVQLVTVVDHPPTPWGGVARDVVLAYESALKEDIREKAANQLRRFGDPDWPVEVRTGDPATVINDLALELPARLIMVGLGGHGATARLFGSETALRLIRVAHTPVLAVARNLRTPPRRIVVAMDFSEASIDGARLALELAAKDASLILVHVVPWERKEYIPEEWFSAHETKVAAELSRVSRWLDETMGSHIGQRMLYGKVARTLLSFADEIGADLIVAGTHGRSPMGRVLAGETVAKLVRGARCSVLVQPRHAP